MSLPRVFLAVAAIAIVGLLAIGVADEFRQASIELGPYPEDLYESFVQYASEVEESYLTYGHWHDFLVASTFAALLVAFPFVRGTDRAKHLLVAGAAIAVVGDAIDLSQMGAIDWARWAASADMQGSFLAADTFRFSINQTSTFVWIAGLFLIAVGLLILARDAQSRILAMASVAFATVLAATGLLDIFGPGWAFDLAMWMLAVVALPWIVVAWSNVDDSRPTESVLG